MSKFNELKCYNLFFIKVTAEQGNSGDKKNPET